MVREANHTGVGRRAAPIDPKRCNRSLGRAFLARVLFWFGVSTFPNYGIVCTVLRCGAVRGRAITVGVIWEGVFFCVSADFGLRNYDTLRRRCANRAIMVAFIALHHAAAIVGMLPAAGRFHEG